MLQIEEASEKIKALEDKVITALNEAGLNSEIKYDENDKINIVFAGQYSAGKSSILKMLTGIDDIGIGAGITTQQTHTYEWNGLFVTDTLGIHTELRPDHDEIAYEEISAADMLVYVITYNLFDSFNGEHFRKLAIEKDKAGEMILVINKMNDTAKGNCPEQQDIIMGSTGLKDVIAPYSPEDLNLCFLDAKSYLESIDESDKEIADELYDRSGYEKFVETLNRFVREKGLTSKLTTKPFILSDLLEKHIKDLEPKSSDDTVDALKEHLMQQRGIVVEKRNSLKDELKGVFATKASYIKDLGTEAANIVVEGCTETEIKDSLNDYEKQIKQISQECEEEVSDTLKIGFGEIDNDFTTLENSEFSQNIKKNIGAKFNDLPENVKQVINNISGFAKSAGAQIANNSYKAGVAGGLKLSNFSGGNIHQIVLKVGNKIGLKFKPWQAIKLSRGISVAGQVVGIAGAALGVIMQIKADSDDEKARESLKECRMNIRSMFNDSANSLIDNGTKIIEEYVTSPLDKQIKEIDNQIQLIRETEENRSELCKKLELLKCDCQNLIHDIHAL